MANEGRPAHYEPGWMDVAEYLAHLRSTTGIGWSVCIAATGQLKSGRHLVFSVCQWKAGAPVVRDDIALVADAWPGGSARGVASTVHNMLYRFDRRLAEREELARERAAF